MRLFYCLFCCLTAALTTQGQQAIIHKDTIQSDILKENRDIEIFLPDQYNTDTAKYDVWYVLDGEWNTQTFVNIHRYLLAIGFAPPVIIVSIPNRYVDGYNYRDRDLTPTATAEIPNSGGAQGFLEFIATEVMPLIKERYRTSERNGIFGSSFGGLFTMYVLLMRPTLFNFYALSDPAFHYDNHYITKLAAQTLSKIQFTNTVLNIGGRSGRSFVSMARQEMDSLLRTSKLNGLHWHSDLYDDETHSSSTFKSNYDGLKFAYLGYSSRDATFHLTGGIVLKEQPVRIFFPSDHADIRYTTDGTIPGDSAMRLDEYFLVSDPGSVVVKAFSPSGLYDRIIPLPLVSGNHLTPKKLSKKTRLGGRIDSITNNHDDINGFIVIPRDGYYLMQLTPSMGTKLYFNDSLWINTDRQNSHIRQTIVLPLRKGAYSFQFKHPSKKENPPLDFGLYYSESGQDDWWKNPVVK